MYARLRMKYEFLDNETENIITKHSSQILYDSMLNRVRKFGKRHIIVLQNPVDIIF